MDAMGTYRLYGTALLQLDEETGDLCTRVSHLALCAILENRTAGAGSCVKSMSTHLSGRNCRS